MCLTNYSLPWASCEAAVEKCSAGFWKSHCLMEKTSRHLLKILGCFIVCLEGSMILSLWLFWYLTIIRNDLRIPPWIWFLPWGPFLHWESFAGEIEHWKYLFLNPKYIGFFVILLNPTWKWNSSLSSSFPSFLSFLYVSGGDRWDLQQPVKKHP